MIMRRWSDRDISPDRLPCRPDVPVRRAGERRGRCLREMHLACPLDTPEGTPRVSRELGNAPPGTHTPRGMPHHGKEVID
jgi:hypothetical protein